MKTSPPHKYNTTLNTHYATCSIMGTNPPPRSPPKEDITKPLQKPITTIGNKRRGFTMKRKLTCHPPNNGGHHHYTPQQHHTPSTRRNHLSNHQPDPRKHLTHQTNPETTTHTHNKPPRANETGTTIQTNPANINPNATQKASRP